MTLGKEEIQKLVLGGLMLIGLVYCYFTMLLGPMQVKRTTTQTQIDQIRVKITEAKKQISRATALEAAAPAHALTVKQLSALVPDGSPVAWFPTRLSEHFKQYGLDKATTRLNSEAPEPQLTGFRQTTWGVEFQKAEFGPLAVALAGFENEHLLAEISNLQLDVLKDDPASQHVTLTLNHLVKQ
jgi:hypothetical protein